MVLNMLEVYYTYIGELKEAIDGYCFAKMQTFCLIETMRRMFTTKQPII